MTTLAETPPQLAGSTLEAAKRASLGRAVADPASTVISPATATATVLVVDDQEGNRDLIRRYISGSYTIVEAKDGAGALECIRNFPVDLVLLDVMMPGTSGFDVCRKIKDQPREGFLPVVLLTALDQQENRNRGLEAGADDYLTKPIDRRELGLRIKTFLRMREQDSTIRKQLEEAETRVEMLIRKDGAMQPEPFRPEK